MSELILRAPEERDIPALHEMILRPAVQWGTGRLPYQKTDWVAERVRARTEGVHSLVAEKDGTAIGWATLTRGPDRRSHSGSLAITVHDLHHRQGVGRALMTAILDLADNWLGLIRTELEVNIDNHGAIALYRAFGFEDEGIRRASLLRDGVYVDSLLMGRLMAPRPTAGAPGEAFAAPGFAAKSSGPGEGA